MHRIRFSMFEMVIFNVHATSCIPGDPGKQRFEGGGRQGLYSARVQWRRRTLQLLHRSACCGGDPSELVAWHSKLVQVDGKGGGNAGRGRDVYVMRGVGCEGEWM